jgi:hypothetical protein
MHSKTSRMVGFACGLAMVVLAVAACDGGGSSTSSSGVARSKYLDQLTTAERTALCTWAVEAEGGPHAYSCDSGVSGSINDAAQCTSDLGMDTTHCQVALVEDCINSTHGDACQVSVTAACREYMSCFLSRD